ncbi:MAG: 23S rRNA (uracil(1939)-C(5))-methyltransferase RlmD [Clostridia bacterium]|nr:23S rRNA (uracil(1939)-C(5))-methyltransferase RlmD [Clostridia bacterium]
MSQTIKKNDILSAKVDAVGMNGEGVVRYGDVTFFVPFAIEGEEVAFKVLKIKKNIGYGKLEKVISPSISRISPVCPVFSKCGGCQLQHVEYKKQLEFKAAVVKNCFKKIAGVDISIDKLFYSPKAYGYRNKLQLPTRFENGENVVGFFRPNSHSVVKTDTCPIHLKWADLVIASVKEFVERYDVALYDENTHKGLLRHVVAREIGDQYVFTFVVNGESLKKADGLIAILKNRFEDFSVYVNVNKSTDNVILGENFTLIYGKGYAEVEEFGIKYKIGAEAFFQVNTPVKTEIYGDVLDFIGDDAPTVVDAYAGAGVLTAMLAKRAKTAYGVEIVKEACDSAEALAKDNGISNMRVIAGDCEKVLPDLIRKISGEGQKTVVVFDPPRKGVDEKTIAATLECLPDEIIYISCSPQTLSRDVGLIVGSLKYENGGIIDLSKGFSPNYDIKFVGVYDMFAQTKHVETLVCLSRK